MAIPAEAFFLDPDFQGTKQRQIQALISGGILSGRFEAGEKLPSSRALARHLGVSRITVSLAYGDLLADDYLTSKGRSGYYISDTTPKPFAEPKHQSKDTVDWTRAIGHRFSETPALEKPKDWRSYQYPFIYGQVDDALFDRQSWRACALQALGSRDFDALTGDHFDEDDPLLVEFILRHTLTRRGIAANANEVLVTMGAQNALWLTTQILLNQRRHAAIEDPCYPSLRAILEQSRCHVIPVPVDAQGLPTDALPAHTDVVFTTPSHQCPTMATMPLDRRRDLLRTASKKDMIIVEDDYDFEMSFLGPPHPALKSLDREGRVIYVGSFSKSIFPGLRLGYLVGPAPFIREARALRSTVLRHPPGLIQRTAAYFMRQGHYNAMIRRMSRIFEARSKAMEAALEEHRFSVMGGGAFGGSSLWIKVPEIDTDKLAERLRQKSVLIEAGRPFFNDPSKGSNFFRIAYSSIPEDRIANGVSIIADACRGLESEGSNPSP